MNVNNYDMGADDKTGSVNSNVARDAYGFALHYYQDDAQLHYDYKAIGTGKKPFANPGLIGSTVYTELYNGNIGAISMNIPKAGIPLLSIYKYDQLNRLKNSFNYTGLNPGSNSWTRSATQDFREVITYDPNGNIKTYKRNGSIAGGGQQLMDNLTYHYISGTNQLSYVDDAVSSANYSIDIDDQNALNYSYDEIGNLTSDVAEGITNIDWNVYGKISSITKTAGTINYTYDASGNRISKTYNGKTTWYVRDASGNVMSVYVVDAAINSGDLTQSEIHLYGSSRLGILNLKKNVENPVSTSGITIFERGNKFFELSNHLGNVLVTISDRKLQHTTDGTTVDYYEADVITANDYYPFGMQMPGRNFRSDSYRYGFNGQEYSDEINKGNYTAEYWEYDSRTGRRWNVDPLTRQFSYQSPYCVFDDNPIYFTDPTGMASEGLQGIEWHPETDTKGNTILVADKGDNINTLKEYINSNMKDIFPQGDWDQIEVEINNVASKNNGNIEGYAIGQKYSVSESYTYYASFGNDGGGGSSTSSTYKAPYEGVTLTKKDDLYKKTNYKKDVDADPSYQAYYSKYNIIVAYGIDAQYYNDLPGNEKKHSKYKEETGNLLEIIKTIITTLF